MLGKTLLLIFYQQRKKSPSEMLIISDSPATEICKPHKRNRILKVSTVNGSNLSCNLYVIPDSTQMKQLFLLHQLRYPSANIFCIIIMQRVSSAISEDIREEQAAFQVRSCAGQFFALEINPRAMPRVAKMMQAVHFNDFQQASIASTVTVSRRLQITGNFY